MSTNSTPDTSATIIGRAVEPASTEPAAAVERPVEWRIFQVADGGDKWLGLAYNQTDAFHLGQNYADALESDIWVCAESGDFRGTIIEPRVTR